MPSARTFWTACLWLCALSLLLHGGLARFAHPMADDFSYAHKDISLGMWNATVWEYLHWNGRYASNYLVLLGPLRLGLAHLALYRAVPVLLILGTLGAQWYLLRKLFTRNGIDLPALPIALLWSACFLCIMPDIGEGFYWYTGAVTYQLANIVVLLALACALDQRPTLRLVAAALFFLAVGFNEVTMLLLLTAGTAYVAVRGLRRGYARSTGLMVLLIAVGAVLMFIAPGNAGRGQHFPQQHQLLRSLGMSALQTVRFGALWVLNVPVLSLSLLLLLGRDRILPLLAPLTRGLRPWMTTLTLCVLIFLCAFPAYWGTGILGQHRTLNVGCFFFLPLWCLHVLVCANTWLRSLPSVPLAPLRAVLLLLFASTVLFTGNGYEAVKDLFGGRAAHAAEQLESRYALLEDARSSPDPVIELPLIQDPPRSIYVMDIRPDPEFLQNMDYVLWFGLNGRRVVPEGQIDRTNATN